jgi:hypothetical protein
MAEAGFVAFDRRDKLPDSLAAVMRVDSTPSTGRAAAGIGIFLSAAAVRARELDATGTC